MLTIIIHLNKKKYFTFFRIMNEMVSAIYADDGLEEMV